MKNVSIETLVGKTFKRADKDFFVKVISEDEKTKTVMLETAEGKTLNLQRHTLKDKRKWVEVADEPAKEEVEEPVVVEEKPVEIVEETPVELPKEKDTKKAKKSKNSEEDKKSKKNNVNSDDISKLLEFVTSKVVELGGVVGIPSDETFKFRPLQYNGRQFIKLMWTKKEVKLFCKESNINGNTPTKVINYSLPCQFNFGEYNDETLRIIEDLIKTSIDNLILKNKTKTSKTNKKEEK